MPSQSPTPTSESTAPAIEYLRFPDDILSDPVIIWSRLPWLRSERQRSGALNAWWNRL